MEAGLALPLNRSGVVYFLTFCWLFVGYLLAICWLFVDYLLTICWLFVHYLLAICWLFLNRSGVDWTKYGRTWQARWLFEEAKIIFYSTSPRHKKCKDIVNWLKAVCLKSTEGATVRKILSSLMFASLLLFIHNMSGLYLLWSDLLRRQRTAQHYHPHQETCSSTAE